MGMNRISKEDGGRAKTHRRSGTVDGSSMGRNPAQSQQWANDSRSTPPQPPVPSLPGHETKVTLPSTSPTEIHGSDDYSNHHRGRSHNGNRQDAYGPAPTDPFSASLHSTSQSSSPSKHSRAQGSMSTLATSVHIAADGRMKQRDAELRTTTRESDSGDTNKFPSRSSRHIFEDPDMTDTSSSVYSMDELIRAIPQIHPLYVRRIAEMGSPGRSPAMSPQPSPNTLQEYTA